MGIQSIKSQRLEFFLEIALSKIISFIVFLFRLLIGNDVKKNVNSQKKKKKPKLSVVGLNIR